MGEKFVKVQFGHAPNFELHFSVNMHYWSKKLQMNSQVWLSSADLCHSITDIFNSYKFCNSASHNFLYWIKKSEKSRVQLACWVTNHSKGFASDCSLALPAMLYCQVKKFLIIHQNALLESWPYRVLKQVNLILLNCSSVWCTNPETTVAFTEMTQSLR